MTEVSDRRHGSLEQLERLKEFLIDATDELEGMTAVAVGAADAAGTANPEYGIEIRIVRDYLANACDHANTAIQLLTPDEAPEAEPGEPTLGKRHE